MSKSRSDFRGNRQSGLGFGGPGLGNDRYYGGMSDTNTKIESVSVEDLLCNPGRKTRPEHIVVILRGLPGSGKSHVAKLLKVIDLIPLFMYIYTQFTSSTELEYSGKTYKFQDKEVTNGGGAPRILSIDDYFMADHDIVIKDPDTGRTVTKTVIFLFIYGISLLIHYM